MYSGMKTYCILFVGVLALSTSAIWVKIADAPSGVIAFYRLLIAALTLTPFLLFSRKHREEVTTISRKQWIQIGSAGLFLALHYVLWFESLQFTSIASSAVLVSLQPLYSLALERMILKIKLKPTALLGCAISLIGSAIIGFGDFRISGMSLFGDILALVAAGVISCYFFIGQNVREKISTVTYSTLSYFASAAVLLLYIGVRGDAIVGYTDRTYMAFLGLALVATIGGQFLFNLLLKKIPASAVTMSILAEPVGTCVLAYLFLREGIGMQQLVGIIVIIGGLFVYFRPPQRKKIT